MKQLIKPNFKRSNVNVSATLAEFLHAPNSNSTLPKLKKELSENYKNVVFICFDGLGIYPMQRNLDKQDFLWKHTVQKLRSTFPSTTTNATTSLISNTLPLQHGWFGWSVNFAEMGRNVNIFLNTDSWTNEKLDIVSSPLANVSCYFDQARSNYEINTVLPHFVKTAHPERNSCFDNLDGFFDNIQAICAKEGKQFVYCYCPEPDHSMHEQGVTCSQTKQLLKDISNKLQLLSENCKNTLFVVTADHGQVDVSDYVYMYKDQKLMDMLRIYPYLEPRAIAFCVKDGQHKQFECYFKKTYGKDFRLYKSSRLVKKGYFGNTGDKAHLLGDFVATGTYTHKQAVFAPEQMLFKGHHAGLTEEMEVPLILIK